MLLQPTAVALSACAEVVIGMGIIYSASEIFTPFQAVMEIMYNVRTNDYG